MILALREKLSWPQYVHIVNKRVDTQFPYYLLFNRRELCVARLIINMEDHAISLLVLKWYLSSFTDFFSYQTTEQLSLNRPTQEIRLVTVTSGNHKFPTIS